MYKRHYEAVCSIYYICTLSNKLKCKQRVIVEKGKPYKIRFKGPGHNHSRLAYCGPRTNITSLQAAETVKSMEMLFSEHD